MASRCPDWVTARLPTMKENTEAGVWVCKEMPRGTNESEQYF